MPTSTYQFNYPITRHRRGLTIIILSFLCDGLFSFFLLVGFGLHLWSIIATLILTIINIICFFSGLSLCQSGKGNLQLLSDHIILSTGKHHKKISLNDITNITFVSFFRNYYSTPWNS